MSRITKELDRIGCDYLERFSMSGYTSMRVGGSAELIVYPKSSIELIAILNALSSLDFPWIVLGGGSNTIIGDEGLKAAVVSTKRMRGFKILEDGRVIADAGAVMSSILNSSIRAGLTGFEFAAGIPGTVGGGVFMNAGANDGEIKDVVETVWVWSCGRELALSRDELKFEYRKSYLPKDSVVTKAMFSLRNGNGRESKKRVRDYLQKRNKTQPVTMLNSGSIFKNPAEIPAGKLLEELGFKGKRVGGAMFSELHANFIVNTENATASDVITLIESAKQEAFKRCGVKLETEVKIIESRN